jgi:hypothetical protein
MAKKDKKEMVEEVEEEVLEEEPVPEPTPEPVRQGRIEVKRIPGIGYTNIVYDNGEFEKVYD